MAVRFTQGRLCGLAFAQQTESLVAAQRGVETLEAATVHVERRRRRPACSTGTTGHEAACSKRAPRNGAVHEVEQQAVQPRRLTTARQLLAGNLGA